jgi:hypothetical protein
VVENPATPAESGAVNLKDPVLAGFLAWLIPGAGHFYQRRTGKGILYFVCILSTYFFGLYLGGGRVVYASWQPEDKHLPYLCQVGAGLPALPALVQTQRVRNGKEPWWNGVMAPPKPEELDDLRKKYHRYFELGEVYTMIAGLLNILAVYDAFAGPAQYKKETDEDDESPPPAPNPKTSDA